MKSDTAGLQATGAGALPTRRKHWMPSPVAHHAVFADNGLAADEEARVNRRKSKLKYVSLRYPLVEYGVTEKEALSICKKHGFFEGGVYDHFARVSCFCCPLQSKQDLRKLYLYYPDLWKRLQEMDAAIAPAHRHKGFVLKKPLSVLSKEIEQWEQYSLSLLRLGT